MSSTSSSSAEIDAAIESEDENKGHTTLERRKIECSGMVQLLKNLEDEEHNIDCQLKILAREALMCGYDPHVVEPSQPKRRRTAWKASIAKKKQVNTLAPESTTPVAERTPSESDATPSRPAEVPPADTEETADAASIDPVVESPSAS